MFRLEVDFRISFIPPMEEHRPGICLTRAFDLPFPPTEGLHLTGKCFHPDHQTSDGFKLEDVTWDVDRQVFLASTSLVCQDYPLAFIPDDLRELIDQGWRLGSVEETYPEPEAPDVESETEGAGGREDEPGAVDEVDKEELLPSADPRSRPASFNKLFRALVREMAVTYNNWHVAYAMDRTQRFFTEEELRGESTSAKEAFRQAVAEFGRKSIDEQLKWQKRVTRTHPRLDRIVASHSR